MTLDKLEEKVQLLEDIEEIKELHREYIYYFANRQWPDLLDCFTEDATADIGNHKFCKGKKEIAELVYNILDKLVKPTHGHFLDQPMISVKGNKARGNWLMYLFFADPQVRRMQCLYECEYVKVDGKWKFSSVEFISPWPPTGPDVRNIQFSYY